MNAWYFTIGFAVLHIFAALISKEKSDKNGHYTRASIYCAASFIIIAIFNKP